jgi:hypothetical protein
MGASFNVAALRDPQQWHLRAERIRDDADSVDDPVTRRSMLDIADKYERVGKFLELKRQDLSTSPAAPSTRAQQRTHRRV